MKETALEIKVNSYPPQAKNLVDIWINYAKSSLNSSGIEFITFVHRRPKNPMSVENFIYLMAKCGVDMEIKEAQR